MYKKLKIWPHHVPKNHAKTQLLKKTLENYKNSKTKLKCLVRIFQILHKIVFE